MVGWDLVALSTDTMSLTNNPVIELYMCSVFTTDSYTLNFHHNVLNNDSLQRNRVKTEQK